MIWHLLASILGFVLIWVAFDSNSVVLGVVGGIAFGSMVVFGAFTRF